MLVSFYQTPHTINLAADSCYSLVPLQLEDLARATPPDYEHNTDSIEQALSEMVALASSMNEEKRDSESRRKLVK